VRIVKSGKIIQTTILLFLGLLASGCDSFHAISRSAQVNQLPTKETIEAAVRNVPGVKGIRYQRIDPQPTRSPWLGPWGKTIQRPSYDAIYYYSDHASGWVELQENEKGDKFITLYFGTIGSIPPASVIQTVDLMDQVYASLRQNITNLPPESEMNENYIRLKKPGA
jgi:hypothetical protein